MSVYQQSMFWNMNKKKVYTPVAGGYMSEYQQSMFWNMNKKKVYTPVAQFYYCKSGNIRENLIFANI